MRKWLSIRFSYHTQLAMDRYELTFTIFSPGKSTAFMEFSPTGRFLAVGDQDSSHFYILDRLAGFHSKISATTPAKPTALVWETSTTFYVGLIDGRFIYYRMDLGGSKLVNVTVNNFFHGSFPMTAIALDAESKTLALSVGPDVFVLRRIRAASAFYSLMNRSGKLTLLQVNSTSLQTSQTASISKKTPGAQLLRFQDPSVSLLTRLLSPFAARI
jgi:hypothetical protein